MTDYSDLIARLRLYMAVSSDTFGIVRDCHAAADAIKRLSQRVQQQALEKISLAAQCDEHVARIAELDLQREQAVAETRGLIEQHHQDSATLRQLCSERDKAKTEAKSWQDYSGICNQANERMQAAAYDAGCPDEVDVADWISQALGDKSAIIAALQKALAYWMPKVFDERSGHDAYLLIGYQGETEECWGDKQVDRIADLESQLAAQKAVYPVPVLRPCETSGPTAPPCSASQAAGVR